MVVAHGMQIAWQFHPYLNKSFLHVHPLEQGYHVLQSKIYYITIKLYNVYSYLYDMLYDHVAVMKYLRTNKLNQSKTFVSPLNLNVFKCCQELEWSAITFVSGFKYNV